MGQTGERVHEWRSVSATQGEHMEKRQLGRGDNQTSPLGLGCWAIGGPFYRAGSPVGWGEVDDAESTRAIQRGLDLGVTLFDTANVYGAGHSERVLGAALRGRRQDVTIATKFGNVFDEDSKEITGADATPAAIREQCEASLRRLGTDYIDLFQMHIDQPAERVPDVLDALDGLVAEGKIRGYGWSTDDPDKARMFAERPQCIAVQFTLNVLQDNAAMREMCDQTGIAGLNRGPLAMGLLTGKFNAESRLPADDIRGAGAPWMQYFKDGRPNEAWLERLASIREILTSGGRSLTQGALAWIWGRSERMLPIPGFRTVAQVEENAGAMQFGALSPDQIAEIDAILGR
jgi:aryl-alcohol dehydrogenase-like predicted oxidoreductase